MYIFFLHFLQAEVMYAEEKSKTREFSEEKKCNKVSDEKIISGMNVKIEVCFSSNIPRITTVSC